MRLTTKLANLFVIAALAFSLFFQNFQPAQASTPAQDTGVRTGYNGRTGKLSFVGTDPANPVTVKAAQNPSFSAKERGLALIAPYASQFGLKDVQKELTLRSTKQVNKLEVTRYQQTYQGLPVMGGELVLNATPKGGLVALSGEVSPDLALDVTPTIDAARASETALQAVAKWNKMTADALTTSAPELWIYDPRLLSPEGNTPELVWRMEVTPKDGLTPIRELVLVNAKRGNIALHFNQVDTAWQGQRKSSPSQLFSASIQPAEQRTTAAPIDLTQPQTLSDVQAQTSGTTWYVATTGNDANSCTDTSASCLTINGALGKAAVGDTIKVGMGTYTGSSAEVVNISIGITLSGGWNAGFTSQSGTSTIDGQGLRRGITTTGIPVFIDSFTIQNGFNGSQGGGIYSTGTLTLSNSIVTGNVSHWMGGGIYNLGTMTVNTTLVTGNSAGDSCCSGGGGGGGIQNYSGTLTLNNSTVSKNVIIGGFSGSGIDANNTVILNNSTVSDNTGGSGEGIYTFVGTIFLNNSTISGNGSYGIKNQAGNVSLKNTIIAGNKGISDCFNDTSYSGTINSQGYNLIGNSAGCTFTATTGDLVNVNANLGKLIGFPGYLPLLSGSPAIDAGNPAIPGSGGNACLATDQRGVARPVGARCDIGAYEYTIPGNISSLSSVSGSNQHAGSNLAFSQPLKVTALDSQGSPVPNVSITFTAPGSGASGTFANTGTRTSSAVTDVNGIATTSIFTANSQLGAYTVSASASGAGSVNFNLENAAWFVATTGNDSNNCSSSASPCLTINGAIVKAINGDAIVVAIGTYIGSSSEVVAISKNITLSGGWNSTFTGQTGLSIIDGGGARRCIAITNAIVGIDHFTIQNGFHANQGGGIYNYNGTLTISNSIINNNVSQWMGGGIFNYGTMTINNTTISGNSAGSGGTGGGGGAGIENYNGVVTINNSAVINNALIGGYSGSGIDTNGTVVLNNSTLSGNSGGSSDGIYTFVGTIVVNNSTISHNQSRGVTNVGGTVTFQNTIVAGNGTGGDCYNNSSYSGTITSLGHNLIGNITGCSISAVSGDQFNIDPKLGAFLSQKGYYPLLLGSPAIDAGNSATCLSTDQRGVSRPQGAACDIGAFEYRGNGTTPAYLITYDGTPQNIEIGKPAPKNLKVFVFDENGDAVSGKTVTFTAPASGASATFAATGTNVSTAITDTNGLATSSVVSANNIGGSYTIQATMAGLSGSADFQLTNLDPSLPTNIALISGSGQSVKPQKPFQLPLKVRVTNYLGQPVAGVTVTYTAPASGASAVFANTENNVSTAITDVSGISSSATLSANNLEGSYVITATVNGLAGSVNFQLSNAPQQIKTYTANNSSSLPGAFLCNQTQVNCTNGANPDADAAQRYAIGTYNFYLAHHNRDSIDNKGMSIISTVHYCPSSFACPYDNAYWSGTQMVYGDGYPAADDIVAHELTHGVTQYESNLYYYYQSGAISESFSDLWGELYDQSNGMGNDSASVKWQIGEDAPGGAFRSMSNPPAFGDPDAITSPNYFTGWQDSGGVHTNSGVNNKAAFLMVDGGIFNGKTVTALGADKTLAIYYEVQTNLLTSGSDYADLYNALYQACLNLVGTQGILSADCQAVRNATEAVAMNAQPTSNPNFNTDAPLCDPDKMYKGDVFFDDLESGTGNWTFNNGANTRWQYSLVIVPGLPHEVYAHSGIGFLYASDYPAIITDATAALKPVAIPANAYLHFAHAYDFEYDTVGNYDGGVLEYSINGSSTWHDAGALMQYNGYKGPISSGYGNPLSGRSAFVTESHGYISTRLNLSSLAGQNVSFRWRMGLDNGGDYLGWFVDDVRIYTCAPAPDTTITSNPDSLTEQTSATFAFTSTKPGSTFACSLDGAPYSACTSPQTYNGLALATHNFSVRATDTDGNTDPTPASYAWTISPLASINVYIGTNATPVGSYSLFKSQSARVNYAGVNNGPLKITSTNGTPIIAALRDAWQANGIWTSFAQLMGLPASQVSDTYYFPAYNNISLDEQLRFGNVGTADTTITVTIGGLVKGSYFLHPGESARVNYAGVNGGPVIVQSSGGVDIIAAERDAWQWNGVWYSFVQLMGLPASQLSDTYYFPAYNNISLDEQLRFGNVGTADTTVTVTIGGQVKGSYFLHPNESARVNYAGVNSGPVVVQSSDGVPIIVAERDAWQTNGVWTSFAQTMGLPVSQVSDTYVFPAYNNISLDEQLRFGNVGTADTTVTVTIGGQPMGSYFLHPSESARVNYAGVNSGPVIVKSSGNVPIIAAERDAWQWNGVWYSFVQTMGLPAGQLSDTYVFPAYNNISLDEQLRFGVP